MARKKRDRVPPYFFYTCPGCEKQGPVMFLPESLPMDWTCSCGMGAHLVQGSESIVLTFDHPDWVKAENVA